MLFSKQERILRVSKHSCLCVHIYIQEQNIKWFTDAIFQEILQGIRPALGEKIAECKQGVKAVSELKNRAFQAAYYVVQADTNMQVLVQELVVKEEKETEDEGGDCSADIVQEVGQFAYKGLRPAKGVLILVAEPFDANNPIILPSVLQISAK